MLIPSSSVEEHLACQRARVRVRPSADRLQRGSTVLAARFGAASVAPTVSLPLGGVSGRARELWPDRSAVDQGRAVASHLGDRAIGIARLQVDAAATVLDDPDVE